MRVVHRSAAIFLLNQQNYQKTSVRIVSEGGITINLVKWNPFLQIKSVGQLVIWKEEKLDSDFVALYFCKIVGNLGNICGSVDGNERVDFLMQIIYE